MRGAPESAESAKAMADMTVLADRGYIGMDKHFEHIKSRVPHKGKDVKPAKEIRAAYRSKNTAAIAASLGLTIQQYMENKSISSDRSLVERVIGRLKRWEVLSGIFRGSASELNRQFEILSGVVNMDILWPEIERTEAPLLESLMAKRAAYKKPR